MILRTSVSRLATNEVPDSDLFFVSLALSLLYIFNGVMGSIFLLRIVRRGHLDHGPFWVRSLIPRGAYSSSVMC